MSPAPTRRWTALAEARAKNDFSSIAALERALAFNVSGHVLHSLFWQNLAPKRGRRADRRARRRRSRATSASFSRFRDELINAATTIMGSGWAALFWDPMSKRLLTTQIHDHQNEITQGGVPILVLDAWEHAYYLHTARRRRRTSRRSGTSGTGPTPAAASNRFAGSIWRCSAPPDRSRRPARRRNWLTNFIRRNFPPGRFCS